MLLSPTTWNRLRREPLDVAWNYASLPPALARPRQQPLSSDLSHPPECRGAGPTLLAPPCHAANGSNGLLSLFPAKKHTSASFRTACPGCFQHLGQLIVERLSNPSAEQLSNLSNNRRLLSYAALRLLEAVDARPLP